MESHFVKFGDILIEITPPLKLQLIGVHFYGDPFHSAQEWNIENEIGTLWKQFGTLSHKFPLLFGGTDIQPSFGYEVHYEPEDFKSTKKYHVFVGMHVDYIPEIPLDMIIKPLPLTQYLIVSTVVKDETTISNVCWKWLGTPEAGYQQAYPYIIERYGSEFTNVDDPTSKLDWMIPVKLL